jgi:hypothetical protein
MLIAIAMLVSIVSGPAQGLISQSDNTGEVILGDVNLLLPAPDLTLSDPSSQMIEANRGITLYNQSFASPLPPTPVTDPSSGFQPPVSSLTIQTVPEPSPFALLTIGSLIGVVIFRRSRIYARL